MRTMKVMDINLMNQDYEGSGGVFKNDNNLVMVLIGKSGHYY